ncbi:phosphatidate cytidylyltransferase [Spirochaetota bacterium]
MSDIKRNTLFRVLSAVVALPVYFFAIITDLMQSFPILILSLAVTLITLHEFYQITDRGDDGKPFISVGFIFAIITNLVMYVFAFGKVYGYTKYIPSFDARVVMGLGVIFLSTMLIIQIFKRPIKAGIYSIGVTIIGVFYIVFAFSHIILLKALSNGIYYIIILNIVIMFNDIFAYFGGVLFGKHKTNFAVSPNKSWEGYFSGLLFGMLGMIITNHFFASFFSVKLFTMIECVILGILLSVLGSIGDLAESFFKREGSFKDSGSIIPGHGGMWDVFDALIFTYPIFYYYLVMKGIP